jgi:hypothetical protein
MLASSSSSGEPCESPFSRPAHFREGADNYDCARQRATCAAHTITRPEDGYQSPRVVRKDHTKDIDLSDTDYPASAR